MSKCGNCHGLNQAPLFAVGDWRDSLATLDSSGLIDINNSSSSKLITKLNAGHQNFSPAVIADISNKVINLVNIINKDNQDIGSNTNQNTTNTNNMGDSGSTINPLPEDPTQATDPTLVTFSKVFANTIQPKCVSCHRSGRDDGGVRLDNYTNVMKVVSPRNANGSRLYTSIKSGDMPPSGSVSAVALADIKAWIDRGAPND